MRFSPGLQGLRGLAILPVVLSHAYRGSFHGGWVGVDLFFVLSGYLITRLLVSEWERSGSINFRGFYLRRARRLLPALALYLAVVFVVVVEMGQDPTPVLAGAAYVTNLLFAAGHTAGENYIGHLWTLGQEEQFYLLWPLLLFGALAWKGPRFALGVALVLGTASVIESALLAGSHGMTVRIHYGPDTHALPLMLGCAGGLLNRKCGWRTGLMGGAVLIAAFTTSWTAGVWVEVAVSFGALGLVLAADSIRLLAARPLQELGRYSYGIYLWHPLALFLAGPSLAPLAIMAAVGMAVASFHVVEQPIRRLRVQPAY